MKGHDHLIAMRKRGLVPTLVFVDTNATGRIDEETNLLEPDSANVWIEPTDRPSRLDLRCFVGLQASVVGDSADRVARVSAALLRAGARRVISTVFRKDGERFEMVSYHEEEAHGALAA